MPYLNLNGDEQFMFAVAVAILSGVIRGFSGFGAGLIMAPLLALIYGPADTVVIVMFTVFVGSLQMIPAAMPLATKRDLLPIIISLVPATPIGVYALITVDPDMMRRLIGGFVLISAIIMLRGWSYTGARNAYISFTAGIVSGLANGAGAVGGPPTTLYLISSDEPAAVKRANITILSTVMAIMTVIPLAISGMITTKHLLHSAALLIPFISAIILGGYLFGRTNDRVYRLVSLWFLIAVGLTVVIL